MHLAFYVNFMEYLIRDRQAMDIPNVSRLRIAIVRPKSNQYPISSTYNHFLSSKALAILKHKPPSESCYGERERELRRR
jgi:hypothetical protein